MKTFPCLVSAMLVMLALCGSVSAGPLKIGYSVGPSSVAWAIGIQKNWFKEAGADAEDVIIVNTPTNETLQVLASKAVDAIGAWPVKVITRKNHAIT